MLKKAKVIVTGDRVIGTSVQLKDGREVEWKSVPVLEFDRLAIAKEAVHSMVETPFDWILFSSPRAVLFWSETLTEHGVEFPLETQVACIGEATAKVAEQNGFYPDFFPTAPGSEAFLQEFEAMISLSANRPTVLIPASEIGRRLIETALRELGCTVSHLPLYRTRPLKNLKETVAPGAFEGAAAVLFTSPSSVDSFLGAFSVPTGVSVVAMGEFTAAALQDRGMTPLLLPEGEFNRIGEVLC